MNNLNKTATLELLLFVTGEEGLELNQLSELSGMSKFACEQQIERLIEKYQADEESALTIIETAGKYKLATKDSFADILKNYAKTPLNQSLSRSALEVLSIIAYKQPITRLEIDQLRGVNSSGALSTLRAYDLVEKTGTLEVVGRPGLYGTTEFFLDYIGINDLSELPEIDESQFIGEKQVLFNENEELNANQ
ncbi:Segregation and condensation protein B [Lactococcus garvieae]|uniref:Segregation and condensation protein B n=1 Tax=Lactococcus petauri TaxID=1940789 RepID=A0A252CEQ3_9LACT|nr:Segregation and condensation protein B [Lactococcus sp. DD01]MCQ8275968.1 Segregation and condensation protein B [Lactococcus petauri]OAL08814.1 Segregation and condensation protein B [Lactococcus garvieae]MDC7843304.1 Segregation and condensation protein B [Lactococcus petauri]MDC7845211.1 Segregation and condensation protein B [Lactococcus petauri]